MLLRAIACCSRNASILRESDVQTIIVSAPGKENNDDCQQGDQEEVQNAEKYKACRNANSVAPI